MKLWVRIVVLFLTIVTFITFSIYCFMQKETNAIENDVSHLENSVDRLANSIGEFANQNDKLSEIVLSENMHFLEQFEGYKDKFDTYDKLFEQSNQNILGIENILARINANINGLTSNIDRLNENYNRLNHLYNQLNNQPKTDNIENNADMSSLYYGRLYIPDANISVGLYYGGEQYITDREDSASMFAWKMDPGWTIADHNNQEFAKLFDVQVGTTGYILTNTGITIKIKCTEIFNGHNTGRYIVDENGVNAANRTDYMMYTCIDNWRNVRICLWEVYYID